MPGFVGKARKVFNKDSLSNRLLFYILMCSTVLALIITVVQLVWDYRHDVKQIENNIDQIEVSFLQPIAASYWSLDEEQIRVQVDGIMNFPNMQYVMVAEGGENSDAPLIERGQFRKNFDLSRQFDLIFEGEVVGSLFVAASLSEVYDRLIKKSAVLLISQMVKTFIVSVCILWIIYMILIRHLHHMAAYTLGLQLDGQGQPLKLKDRHNTRVTPDELDTLTDTINQMREKIVDELEGRRQINLQLMQEKEFSETVIESSSTVICCMDEALNIGSVNKAGEKITGVSRDQILGESWLYLFAKQEEAQPLKERIIGPEGLHECEIAMETSADEYSIVIWNFVPFYQDDTLQQYIAFGYDVTPLKRVQLELNSLNDDLEAKVSKRTESLKESNQQLELAFDRLKKTQGVLVESEKMASLGGLVAGIAHEINTPLGISLTAASFLTDQTKDFSRRFEKEDLTMNDLQEFTDGLGESTSLLINSLTRASNLVRSFKQVAVDQSSEACYQFNVLENLEQVLTSLNHKMKKISCEVDVECDAELTMTSYPGSFAQIYSNLIINSLIHGFENSEGTPRIRISVELKGNHLCIDYQDYGKGIGDEMAEKIFDPFVTTKRGSGGSGLGTHVIYNLVVQLLKGSIRCDNKVDQGVRFLIKIPHKS